MTRHWPIVDSTTLSFPGVATYTAVYDPELTDEEIARSIAASGNGHRFGEVYEDFGTLGRSIKHLAIRRSFGKPTIAVVTTIHSQSGHEAVFDRLAGLDAGAAADAANS